MTSQTGRTNFSRWRLNVSSRGALHTFDGAAGKGASHTVAWHGAASQFDGKLVRHYYVQYCTYSTAVRAVLYGTRVRHRLYNRRWRTLTQRGNVQYYCTRYTEGTWNLQKAKISTCSATSQYSKPKSAIEVGHDRKERNPYTSAPTLQLSWAF